MNNFITDDYILKVQEDLWNLKVENRTNKNYIADHENRIVELENKTKKLSEMNFNLMIWLMVVSGIIAGFLIGLVIKCF